MNSVELLIQALPVLTFGIVVALCLLFIAFWKRLPIFIKTVLTEVGQGLSEDLGNLFEKPNVKNAFTVLANKSHVARADNALREKVSDKIVSVSPVLKKALEFLDITREEGLVLMQDPIFGPVIQGFMQQGTEGLAGLIKSFQGITTPGQNNPGNKRYHGQVMT